MASQPPQSARANQSQSQREKLTINDLAHLQNVLHNVAPKCFDFGLQLGVKYPNIRSIQQNYGHVHDQLREILAHRLTQLPPLMWHDIVQALQSNVVQMNDLASEIESQHMCQSSHEPQGMAQSHGTSLNNESPQVRRKHKSQMAQSHDSGSDSDTAQANKKRKSRSVQSHDSSSTPQAKRKRNSRTALSHDSSSTKRKQRSQIAKSHDSGSIPHATRKRKSRMAHSHDSGSDSDPPNEEGKHKPQITQYIKHIKALYRQSEVEKKLNAIKWPPTPSTVYINLVCVDRTTHVSKQEADECTRAMVCDGSVDVVLGKKTPIDLSDIAKDVPLSGRKVILVEGAPGVGKSTLAWQFCRRWERGEIAQQYKLVLLLRLRDKGMSEAQSLADLLYHPSKTVVQAVEDELIATLGANTLIILEGFDELSSTCRTQSSVFLRLINGTLLPHATVLVTSRPWATQDLHRECCDHIFQHIEILGFTSKQIEEYVTSVFMDEANVVNDKVKENIEEVMSYITSFPQIWSCMYIPLNSAIVVSVYQESKAGRSILPKTLTELYLALTQTLLLRYLYGHPEHSQSRWKIQSLKDDLPPDVYRKLLAISELAYSGICTDQEGSIQLIFTNLPHGFETLGLMQSVPQLYVTQGEDMSHNFLHLTVQEFLAALHISNMSPEKQLEHFQGQEERQDEETQVKLLRQEEMEGRWKVVLRFLAGITKLATLSPGLLRGLLMRNPNEDLTKAAKGSRSPLSLSQEKCDADQITKWKASMCVRKQATRFMMMPKKWDRFIMTANMKLNIQHVHWMFEAQRNDIVPLVLQERTVEFRGHEVLTPLDYYSLGYCIVHSHCQWVLTIGNNEIGEEEVRMLVAGTNTRQDTSAKVVGLRGYHRIVVLHESRHESGGYCPLSISAEALNVLFVELKNVLHLKELHLNLPAECSNIQRPSLSGIRVLHLGMTGGRNWRLDSLLLHLSLELLVITVSSGEGGLGSDNDVASIEELFLSSNCPKYVDITVQEVHEKQFDDRIILLKEQKPVQHMKCPLDWYSVGYIIAHSNFQWMLTVEQDIHVGVEEVRKLVTGANTRQDTSAEVVGLRGTKGFYDRGGYSHLTISAEALNVLFVELKNMLHLQELHLDLPIQCSDIRWPNLSGLRVLGIGIRGERNWRLDTLLPDLSLKSLTFESATVTLEDCVAIEMFLSSSDCLKYFQFKMMFHKNVEGIESITKALSENESLPLRYLGLEGRYTFSDTAAHHLALFITNSATLHHLSIVRCTFSAHGLLELAQAIHHSSSLQERKLEEWTCTVDGDDKAAPLSVDYPQMMGDLKVLTASHITDQGAQAIATALSHSSTLRRLDLSNNNISDTGLASLAQALYHNSTLKVMALSNTNLSDTGSAALSEALRHNSNLEWLNLSNNSLSNTGSAALGEALRHNSTLKELNLSNTSLGDTGCAALGEALHHNSTLKELNLSNTSLGDTGCAALGEALHHNSNLEWLDLSNTSLSDTGCAALAEALHHNSTLKWLGLSNTSVSDTGYAALGEALHHNSTLKGLDLSGNDAITAAGTHHLVQALTVNTSITGTCHIYIGWIGHSRDGLLLPRRCEECATQCPQYSEVKDRIAFV